MSSPFESVTFMRGPAMKNRLMLAPLTNHQSHEDGTLSDDEFHFLTKRAEGGFGMVMSCASHVHPLGKAFPGQLGCWGDQHLEGLTRLARAIHDSGSMAYMQLHHGGRRASAELIGQRPVAPSEDAKTGARALSTEEVEEAIESFVAAAQRCEEAGFDGVEIHGAHDYLLCEFLSPELNRREDRFGGSREARFQIFVEILDGIRSRCNQNFQVAVRLSPERFGLNTADIVWTFEQLIASGQVDMIDLSLWDVFKEPLDPAFSDQSLSELFLSVDRGDVKVAVAGKLYDGAALQRALDLGADIVALGRAAIVNHDFPELLVANPLVAMRELPVSRAVLRDEGLGEAFIRYMDTWDDFVAPEIA